MPQTSLVSGVLYAFDVSAYTCSVQPDGALTTFLKDVPVSKHLAPSLLPDGARVSLLLFDDNNPLDGMVVGVTTSQPRTPSCRVYRSTPQSIPTGAQTLLSFSAARHDTMASIQPMWTASDPSRVTLAAPGVYIAAACVEFAANASGVRVAALFDTLSNQFIAVEERNAVNGDTTDITCASGPFYAPSASSFQVFVYQSSGAPLDVNADAAHTAELAVALIG